MFKHQEYSDGFQVTISPDLSRLIEDAKECSNHRAFYNAFNVFNAKKNEMYRLYRRGKNRCNKCGVKLKCQD